MQNPSRLLVSLALAVAFADPSRAQEESIPPREVVERTAEELDDLLGPIALYPDDLVALILPAATQPTDIVLAARFLDDNGAVDDIGEQPWDESVRALAHFPDVIAWMNKNLAWTKQIGDAFSAQPADVMKSIQRLRARAFAAGTLKDTPQQRILAESDVIRIVSAEEEVIYVPTYDPEVVFVDAGPGVYHQPYVSFGVGWYVGNWHRWECDWSWNRVWIFDNHDHWREHRRFYRPDYRFNPGRFDRDDHNRRGRAWCPPPIRVRHPFPNVHHPRPHVTRPGRYVEGNSRARFRPDVDRPTRDFTAGDRRDQERRNDRDNDNRTRPPRSAPANGFVNGSPGPTPPAVIVPNPGRNSSPDIPRNRSATPPRNGRDTRDRPPVSVTPGNPPAPTPTPAPTTTEPPRREVDRRDYVQRSRTRPPADVTPAPPRNVSAPAPAPAPAPTPSRATYNPPVPRESRSDTNRSSPPPTRSRATSSDDAPNSPPTAAPKANDDQPRPQPAVDHRSRGNTERKDNSNDSSSRRNERSRSRGD